MELIYSGFSIVSSGLVAAGATGFLFVFFARLAWIPRAILATVVGVAISAGPGVHYNITEIGDSSPTQTALYVMVLLAASFPLAGLLSWLLHVRAALR